MKICIFTHSFPPVVGGAQTYQYNLATKLSQFGHKVLILTGDIPQELSSRIKDYETRFFEIRRVAGFKEFSKMKIPVRDFLEQVYFEIKSFNPDIVYSNGYASGLAYSFIQSAFKAKHVFSYHATPETEVGKIAGIWRGNLEMEFAFTRFVMQRCRFDTYLACSKHYLNFTKKYLNPHIKNCHLVYYGVDMEKFSPLVRSDRKKFGLDKNDFVILCPVRLIERKGILDMLEGLRILVDSKVIKKKNLKLLLPTDDVSFGTSIMDKVDDYIERFKLRNNILMFVNKFSVNDMPFVYAVSDVVVLPSYAEGLGMVLLEAAAMKKSIIATDIPGITEVIKDNETGLLVPVKSPVLISKAIEKINSDPALKNRLIKNAFLSVKRQFEVNKQTKKVEKLFQSLLG